MTIGRILLIFRSPFIAFSKPLLAFNRDSPFAVRGSEPTLILPGRARLINEPEVDLMNQRCRLQRMSLLSAHVTGRQLAQVVIDVSEQIVDRRSIATANLGENGKRLFVIGGQGTPHQAVNRANENSDTLTDC